MVILVCWSPALTHLSLDKMAAISADDNFRCILFNENDRIPVQISLKFVSRSPIKNIPALVQVMAWHQTGNKPFPESMLTHICGTTGGGELNTSCSFRGLLYPFQQKCRYGIDNDFTVLSFCLLKIYSRNLQTLKFGPWGSINDKPTVVKARGGGGVLGPKTDGGVPLAAENWTQKDRGKNEIWGLKDRIL